MDRSSFDGCIEDIPDIYVDNFKNTNKKAYFLSHCHTDHMQGLYNRYFIRDMEKNGAKIYMTEESMKIVKYTAETKGIYNICEFIQPLKLSTSIVSIGDDLHIEVTLIPAGHCLGSVMFLFRVDNKTILYTGDFRIRSNDISKYAQLHKKGDPIKIDVMYVDTTFLTEEHPEFARRSSSVEEMLQKIGKWLEADQCNRVAIHTSATYGYEYVFAKIYKHMGVKVSVDPNTWKRYLDFPNILQVLTTDERDAKIHLCKDIRFKWQCEHNSLRRNRYLSLQLSAASWRHYDEDEKALLEDLNRDYVQVCFATHCSRRELISFVNYFAPGKIVGFPNPYFTSPEKAFNDTYTPTPKKRMLEDPREIEKTDSGSNAVFVKKLF